MSFKKVLTFPTYQFNYLKHFNFELFLNLDNSDLLACTVVNSKNERLSQFLVTDQFQFILVEPDSRKLGWGIVRFVALLQVNFFLIWKRKFFKRMY